MPGAGQSARAIYQPKPKIPDDLREDTLNAVAVARFRIAADGTASVELITPTPNPRLNQVLLDTLKTWRFFPAMNNGIPVSSMQDLRISVEVR
jgi:protein TonB